MDQSLAKDSTEKKYNFEVNTQGTIKVQVAEAQAVLKHNQ